MSRKVKIRTSPRRRGEEASGLLQVRDDLAELNRPATCDAPPRPPDEPPMQVDPRLTAVVAEDAKSMLDELAEAVEDKRRDEEAGRKVDLKKSPPTTFNYERVLGLLKVIPRMFASLAAQGYRVTVREVARGVTEGVFGAAGKKSGEEAAEVLDEVTSGDG